MSTKPYRNAKWLAERMGVKEWRAWDLIRNRQIGPCVIKIGSRYFINEDAFEAYMAEQAEKQCVEAGKC